MRLIDADALIKKWENVHCDDISFEMALIGATNDVKNAPTVDAVPVVRCNDCKRYREYTYLGTQKVYVCERNYRKRIFDMNADDYCSRGERREHETD